MRTLWRNVVQKEIIVMSVSAKKLVSLFSILIAVALIGGQALFTSAASYCRTSLQDMTQRAVAVAEVTVLKRSYPQSDANDFQRTSVEVSVLKTLKGSLPETLTLDLPGGVRGNQVFFVADSADFQVGERAMVFIKEPTPGTFMVQDLGLGKFNIVSRNNQVVVESAVCPKAMETKAGDDADLITKAIPYNDFCALISSYAKNETPATSATKLAMTLPNSGSHVCTVGGTCTAAMDAIKMANASKQTHEWLTFGICAAFLALCAAMVVAIRRRGARNNSKTSFKSVASILLAALLLGAAIGGSNSLAYIASGPIWNLDDTNDPTKVSNGQVVWKQSTQGSQTYSNCFVDVQTSFNKWASITNCRLNFINAGTTTNTVHSSSDNVNFVVWDPNPNSDFSSATLAITYSVYTVGTLSYFIDCDIVFNDRDFSWAPGNRGNAKSVSLHEIGHFVGLAHVTSSTAVMYPYDQGFVTLSSDEVAAGQFLYPGSGTNTPPPANTPPAAVVGASPVSGPAPLNCGFDATASVQGTNPIATYSWNFGDGSTGTGQTIGHVYASSGNFTATLTVTDTQGLSSTATAAITVNGVSTPAGSGTPLKGAFKLMFSKPGHDSFSATILSQTISSFNPAVATGSTTLINGTVTIAGVDFAFTYNPLNRKAYGTNGLKVTVNAKAGTVAVSLKNANLQSALEAVGAANGNVFGNTVNVPVTVAFGDGSNIALVNQIPFMYYSQANKAGQGRY